MFDIAWTELLLIAVVLILVVGPKELPGMLRSFGRAMGSVRRMANEFQSTFNDALREAEREADLGDTKKQLGEVAKIDPLGDARKNLNAALSAKTSSTSVAGNGTTSSAVAPTADSSTAPLLQPRSEIEAGVQESNQEAGAVKASSASVLQEQAALAGAAKTSVSDIATNEAKTAADTVPAQPGAGHAR